VKVTVTVGNVSVTVEGLDYTRGQVRGLLGSVYATACLMAPPEEAANPVGFSAHIERGTDPPEEHLFTDDELE
jgi:hypothetical protein